MCTYLALSTGIKRLYIVHSPTTGHQKCRMEWASLMSGVKKVRQGKRCELYKTSMYNDNCPRGRHRRGCCIHYNWSSHGSRWEDCYHRGNRRKLSLLLSMMLEALWERVSSKLLSMSGKSTLLLLLFQNTTPTNIKWRQKLSLLL